MKDPEVFKGYWFIPSRPDKKVAGILHFMPYERLKLELIGGFDTPTEYIESFGSGELEQERVIWGIDQNAKEISLINCDKHGSLNFSSEFPMINYIVQYAIIGKHIDTWDDRSFFKLNIEMPLLTEWINFRRVRCSMPYSDAEKNGLDSISISV